MMIMKTNELMQGDWVIYPINIPKNPKVRITEIRNDNIKVCVRNETFSADGVDVECLQPIPLTPEILEKNGFNHWDNEPNDFLGDYYTFLSSKDGGYNICIDSIRTISGHIDYVHELQHALKLCGIEKEIVL